MKLGLSFDDVLLMPQYSELDSRDDVVLETDLGFKKLGIPIISSPMDTVTGIAMQKAISELGGLGVHHRYTTTDLLLKAYPYGGVGVSPSMGTKWLESIKDRTQVLVIDVAHGHSKKVIKYAKELVSMGFPVMSGNICTAYAAEDYVKIGVKLLRTGLGSGSACSTRLVAGIGVPQISAIMDIRESVGDDTKIISDGGIRYTGDIIKALAAGADAVMVGRLLAGANEALGERNGNNTKSYRGMASMASLDEAGKERNIEGVSSTVECDGALSDIIARVIKGLKIGFAYLGARNILELQARAEFIQITQAGWNESLPRI